MNLMILRSAAELVNESGKEASCSHKSSRTIALITLLSSRAWVRFAQPQLSTLSPLIYRLAAPRFLVGVRFIGGR